VESDRNKQGDGNEPMHIQPQAGAFLLDVLTKTAETCLKQHQQGCRHSGAADEPVSGVLNDEMQEDEAGCSDPPESVISDEKLNQPFIEFDFALSPNQILIEPLCNEVH
jgi:hypothetical protein